MKINIYVLFLFVFYSCVHRSYASRLFWRVAFHCLAFCSRKRGFFYLFRTSFVIISTLKRVHRAEIRSNGGFRLLFLFSFHFYSNFREHHNSPKKYLIHHLFVPTTFQCYSLPLPVQKKNTHTFQMRWHFMNLFLWLQIGLFLAAGMTIVAQNMTAFWKIWMGSIRWFFAEYQLNQTIIAVIFWLTHVQWWMCHRYADYADRLSDASIWSNVALISLVFS